MSYDGRPPPGCNGEPPMRGPYGPPCRFVQGGYNQPPRPPMPGGPGMRHPMSHPRFHDPWGYPRNEQPGGMNGGDYPAASPPVRYGFI